MKKQIIFRITLFLLFSGIVINTTAQVQDDSILTSKTRWRQLVRQIPDTWYGTDEAKQVAKQVLLYQREGGGWPKNIQMHQPLTDTEKEALKNGTPKGYEPTVDNDATMTEMRFMAKMYAATRDECYKQSFERGLDYILEAQYDNGGWPQFYPLRRGYYSHITFNDNAMSNILNLLKDIYSENPLYAFVATPAIVEKARKAYNKGIECILKCQIYVDGKPTIWCAQHDKDTLEPAKARAYELPSFSGAESVGLILLLMDIPNPSPEIIAAVEGAKTWFEEHKVTGIRIVNSRDGKLGRHTVADPEAPVMWARFYDLETQLPFFCGRDGVKKASLNEIEAERRNGYSYYTTAPAKILKDYPAWKKRVDKK